MATVTANASASERGAHALKKAATRHARSRLEHQSILTHPPRYGWRLQSTSFFAAFLSHFKVEAGMEARYLHDLLQRILGRPVFLDSQNLRNLKDLFIHGLAISDVLVLVATKSVLTRPYCLLELWCAQRFGVPIVVLDVALRNLDWNQAQHTLDNLYDTLGSDAVNLILREMTSILEALGHTGTPPTIREFGQQIADALQVPQRIAAERQRAIPPLVDEFVVASNELEASNRAAAAPAAASNRRGSSFAGRRRRASWVHEALTKRDASGLGEPSEQAPELATLHPWGTDAELLGDTSDVIDMMAIALGRPPPRLAATALLGRRRSTRLRDAAPASLRSFLLKRHQRRAARTKAVDEAADDVERCVEAKPKRSLGWRGPLGGGAKLSLAFGRGTRRRLKRGAAIGSSPAAAEPPAPNHLQLPSSLASSPDGRLNEASSQSISIVIDDPHDGEARDDETVELVLPPSTAPSASSPMSPSMSTLAVSVGAELSEVSTTAEDAMTINRAQSAPAEGGLGSNAKPGGAAKPGGNSSSSSVRMPPFRASPPSSLAVEAGGLAASELSVRVDSTKRAMLKTPKAVLKRLTTMQSLRADPTSAAANTHELLICCSRNQAATVHAANTLKAHLEGMLGGSVCFDPRVVGRFGWGTPSAPSPSAAPFPSAAPSLAPLASSDGFAAESLRRGASSFEGCSSDGSAGLPYLGLRGLTSEPSKWSVSGAAPSTLAGFDRELTPSSRNRRDEKLLKTLSTRLREGIGSCKAVLLLQTERAYTAPLTLLELYFAAREGKPIICLRLAGAKYDFKDASVYLLHLKDNLHRDTPATANLLAHWLDDHMITFEHLAQTLANYIPTIMTLPVAFSASGTANHVAATLSDIERLLTEMAKKAPAAGPSIFAAARFANGLRRSRYGTKREAASTVGAIWRGQRVKRIFRKMRWAALLLTSVWRGHAARKLVAQLKLMRDAAVLIYFHVRRWVKRRRAARGIASLDLSPVQTSAKRMEASLAARRLLRKHQSARF